MPTNWSSFQTSHAKCMGFSTNPLRIFSRSSGLVGLEIQCG